MVDPLLAFYDTEEERRAWADTNARVRREWGTPAYYGAGSPWLHWYDRAEPILAETGAFLDSLGGE